MPKQCDFSGWATKNDLKCSDGRIIRRGAFKVNDGQKVPLVWNHQHNSPADVLGHAVLENRDEGVYAYCFFNDSKNGQAAKQSVIHGDVSALSIWANNLQQNGPEVLHGVIREVSLVLAGANPGAFIESVMAHGEPMDDYDDEGIFYTDSNIFLQHAEEEKKDDPKPEEKPSEEKDEKDSGNEKTIKEVLDTLNDDQKKAVGSMIAMAVQDSKNDKDEKEEEKEMKHNVFESSDNNSQAILTKEDMQLIMTDAKRLGSLKAAVLQHSAEGGILAHALNTTGMEVGKGSQTYGFNDPEMLFPDYKSLNNPPEWISRDMDWVQKVMAQVHHTPFSRIKSQYANITEDEARAKGYIKGKQKKTEVFTILKRTTDPTTIYKLQKLDRDDVIDITDFDVIAWIRAEMRVMLNEEIARAILIGDGRLSDAEDHIPEANVRPIVKDVPLFNTVVEVHVPEDADDQEIAKATIDTMMRNRKKLKGSGSPTFWTTEDTLSGMLLLEDGIGHKLYKSEAELSTVLRAKEIVPVEPMEGVKIQVNGQERDLIGTLVNLADYNVGADKGGAIEMFDDFDLDFNKYEWLIETRISGALTKPFSALTIVLVKDPQ